MPNPWKRSKISSFSRFVASLRPKQPPSAAASPLLVQTGFPTSLADLVVKHRRHRKAHHPRAAAAAAPTPGLASRVFDLVAVVEASQIPADDGGDGEERSPDEARPRPDPVAPEIAQRSDLAPRSAAGRARGGGGGRVGSQAKAVLLMALAVSTRELVLGIMISAIVLLLLESAGGRLLGWIRRREAARRVVAGVSEVDCSIGGVVRTSGFDLAAVDSPERCDLAGCAEEEVAVDARAKKKHWSKLVSEKLRGSRRRKDGEKAPASDGSVHSSSSERSEEEEAEVAEVEVGDVDINIVIKEEKAKGWCRPSGRSYYVFLVLMVLSGLVGGKAVALVLTVACCYLAKITGVFTESNRKIKE